MNAQDKAKELVEKFEHETNSLVKDELAKQCAIIAVDEIINDNPNIYDSDRLNYKYWNAVKKEIEKL